MIFLMLKTHFSEKNDDLSEIEALTDNLMMSMRAGMSLETALWDFSRGRTNGQTNSWIEASEVFDHCLIHPSQSYKLLESFRQTLRMRSKLHRKHSMVSLQAKAQGLVSALLFGLLFLFQLLAVPEFRVFLKLSVGRLVVLMCFVSVFLGLRFIFKMGQPGEFQL